MANGNLIVILGPTASGKTKLAVTLAHALSTEIISADSRQVYREMNIGTGKDYSDYVINGSKIPAHLIDIIDPGEKYHLHAYTRDFFNTYELLRKRGLIPILCGGSGLYLDAVLSNYEYTSIPVNHELRRKLSIEPHDHLRQFFNNLPVTSFHAKADLSTHKRTIRAIEIAQHLHLNGPITPAKNTVQPIIFGLNPEREIRRKKISERLRLRLKQGLIEEVEDLLKRGLSFEQLTYYGLEYKFVAQYLQGVMSREALTELLENAIQQFAKRQMTYFRKMERDGHLIHWLDQQADTTEHINYMLNKLDAH